MINLLISSKLKAQSSKLKAETILIRLSAFNFPLSTSSSKPPVEEASFPPPPGFSLAFRFSLLAFR
jgi:hypothetical protein